MNLHKPPYRLKEIKLEVTHDCFLQCVHCSSMAGVDTCRQMSFEKCHEILLEAVAMGVEGVAFSGGEPLLWDGLSAAVQLSVQLGMDVSLYTTGNVENSEAIFTELKSVGLRHVMFSLFGESRQSHELVTKVEGSYDITLSAVKKCIELGIAVELHFVPLPSNYMSLRPIAEKGKALGVSRTSVLRLVPQGRGAEKGVDVLSLEENKALRHMIIELRKEGHEVRTGSPFNALMLRERPQCCSGIDRLTISPDLMIYPCDAFKQISTQMLGVNSEYSSLAEYSLSECWEKSPYLEKIRTYLTTPFADKCSKCSVLEKCLSGCVAQKFYVHGDLRKCPDPMCLLQI